MTTTDKPSAGELADVQCQIEEARANPAMFMLKELRAAGSWDIRTLNRAIELLESIQRESPPVAGAEVGEAEHQLAEAGKAAIAIRNELDRTRVERDSWKDQFHSAAAAASEYSQFWEEHHGDFDQFGNYIPHSQIDGDLRAAKARIAELEAAPPVAERGGGGAGALDRVMAAKIIKAAMTGAHTGRIWKPEEVGFAEIYDRNFLVAADAILAALPSPTPETGDGSETMTERCPYCSDGARTGLPGNACENCMNTGLKYPERGGDQ